MHASKGVHMPIFEEQLLFLREIEQWRTTQLSEDAAEPPMDEFLREHRGQVLERTRVGRGGCRWANGGLYSASARQPRLAADGT